jgi:hypothetical protein
VYGFWKVNVKRLAVFVLILLPCAESAGFGQSVGATVRGLVKDRSGSVCIGARVTLINEETNETRSAVSSPDGTFLVSVLPPGQYRIETEMAGFRRYIGRHVVLQVGQEVRIGVVLEPGAQAEQVVVNASPALVRQDTAAVGAVVDTRQIANYPLDGRNFLQLSLLVSGTAPAAHGSPGSLRGDFAVNVNGAREDSNNFVLDGVYNNDPKLNSFAINPPADAIREFEILTSSYDAGFGRNAGAQVNVALRSGGNAVHGTVYEFLRNDIVDARNFFAPSDGGQPRYQRNQFGFSIGGPVRRDRTFYFVDYEGRRLREGITQVTNVPTMQERAGDFSESILPAPVNPFTGKPFEGGRIPREMISETGRAIAELYPVPNRSDAGANFISSPILRDRDDRFDVRLDHAISRASGLVARYSFWDGDLYEPFAGSSFARVPGFGNRIPRRAQNVMAGENHVFSPDIVSELRIGFSRVASGAYQEDRGGSLNQKVGLPELSENPRDAGLSFISISGFSPVGDEYNSPQHGTTNTLQVLDHVSYRRGGHLLKSGVEFRNLQQNAYRDVQARGFLAFSDYGQVTGNGLADMLLGFVTYSGGAQLDNPQYLRTRSWNGFVQDSWLARSNLTVLLGLRYEYNSPPVDRFDHASIFDAETGKLLPAGQGGTSRSPYRPDSNNWAPRVGVAWAASGGTVVHAGYGLYFDQSSLAPGEGLYFNPPYYDLRMYFPLSGLPLTINDPFPANYPFVFPPSALGFDSRLRTPYMQHWNAKVQRQLGVHRAFEAAYVGSKGTRILSARDFNQPHATPAVPNVRPMPQYSDILFLESRGNSSFHSFQASLQQRMSGGFAAFASYTLAKSLDDTSTFFSSAGDANFPQDSWNLASEKGRSNFDVRQRLSLSYSCELPFGKGRRFLKDGALAVLLGGWTTNGIVTLQSGGPFTVALMPEIDNSNTGRANLGFGANDRPNRIADGTLPNRGPDQWFDTRAFAFSPFGTFGNSGRNILDGPGYKDYSMNLYREESLSEGVKIQFRAEAFNILNSANFDLPDNYLGSPTFGRVLSAESPRRIQFGVKLIF